MNTKENVLANPSFEDGKTDWAFHSDSKGSFEIVTDAHLVLVFACS
jgi:hypothetical protein